MTDDAARLLGEKRDRARKLKKKQRQAEAKKMADEARVAAEEAEALQASISKVCARLRTVYAAPTTLPRTLCPPTMMTIVRRRTE